MADLPRSAEHLVLIRRGESKYHTRVGTSTSAFEECIRRVENENPKGVVEVLEVLVIRKVIYQAQWLQSVVHSPTTGTGFVIAEDISARPHPPTSHD